MSKRFIKKKYGGRIGYRILLYRAVARGDTVLFFLTRTLIISGNTHQVGTEVN